MTRAIRQLVRTRARCRCEYCRLPDFAVPASTFHVEHVIARQHGGTEDSGNFCWSCHRCNLHKGPNLSGRDPLTGNVVRLYDPRRQSWKRNFEWFGVVVAGRTQTGRATVAVLKMNDPQRVKLRLLLVENGEWPLEPFAT